MTDSARLSSSAAPANPSDLESLAASLLTSIAQVIDDTLRQEAGRPIVGPDDAGMFPSVYLRPMTDVWSFVADANVLRTNILRSCRYGRTVLVSAANMGALRLYCAQHVIDEVSRHGPRWAADAGVEYPEFLRVWRTEYLPLLRLVPEADSLLDMLSEAERERVANLTDRDDVPSVVLAVALSAVLLSEDKRALRAVYGHTVDLAQHKKWLDLLQASGEAHEREALLAAAAGGATGLGACLYGGTRWLVRATTPWVLVPLAAALYLAAAKSPPTVRRNTGQALTLAAIAYLTVAREHQEASAVLDAAAPTQAPWSEVLASSGRDAALTRACLQQLARSASSHLSARQLTERLPHLGIGQGDRRVNEVLRTHPCFVSASPGRWQVGRPIVIST